MQEIEDMKRGIEGNTEESHQHKSKISVAESTLRQMSEGLRDENTEAHCSVKAWEGRIVQQSPEDPLTNGELQGGKINISPSHHKSLEFLTFNQGISSDKVPYETTYPTRESLKLNSRSHTELSQYD